MQEGEAGSCGWWGVGKPLEKRKPCIWASRLGELTKQWREGEDIPCREAALTAWRPGGLWGVN